MRYWTILGGLACAVGMAATATASLEFTATFEEQWHTVENGSNGNVESNLGDLFTFSLSGDCEEVSIIGLKLTLPYNTGQDTLVYFDVAEGGYGVSEHKAFEVTAGATPTSLTGGQDGDTMLDLGFGLGDFSVGSSDPVFSFLIDVDDENAVVKGSNGNPPAWHDMVGGLVDVTYSNGSATASQRFVFGAPDGGPSDAIAVTGGQLACIPEPMSAITWSCMTALVACRVRRRKR